MIKSSSINYNKSSAECLVIGFCLYIAITFHNNLTEVKITNEYPFSGYLCLFAFQENLTCTRGNFGLLVVLIRNCLASTFDYVVMQMRKIKNVSLFTQYPESQFTRLSRVLFPGLHFWLYLGC